MFQSKTLKTASIIVGPKKEKSREVLLIITTGGVRVLQTKWTKVRKYVPTVAPHFCINIHLRINVRVEI